MIPANSCDLNVLLQVFRTVKELLNQISKKNLNPKFAWFLLLQNHPLTKVCFSAFFFFVFHIQ